MVKNIVDYLEATEKIFANKKAYCDESKSITFSNLKENALKIASGILSAVQKTTPVLIYIDKCVECIEAFLGVAYTGAFYVPIDIHMPVPRIKHIINTLRTTVIITRREDSLPEDLCATCHNVFYIEDLLKIEYINDAEIQKRQLNAIDADPAYAIFTSGSTGIPKGVLVSHRSVINFTEWWCETFNFSSEEVFANQTPFFFDASVKDIYATLRCGGTMHIVPKKLFSLPRHLVHFLNEYKITCIDWVPSALCMIVNFNTFEKEKPLYLKKVMFLGEVMPTKQYNMWKQALPNIEYANLYGPTEATSDCAYYKIDREFEDTEPIPIGHACSNTEVMLLGDDNQLITTSDVIGEICVRGCSLALGYYNNPQKTDDSFICNPLQKNYSEKIYRTGDLGKYNRYGEIVFLSRKDSQIKHMGHRIELGEIETVLNSLAGIDRVCCLYNKKIDKIIAIYEGTLEKHDISKKLKSYLPNYMTPSEYKKIPINGNGKIDRPLLNQMYIKET